MTKKIDIYSVNGKKSDVYDISLVEFPAIESDFVYFNKQDELKKFVCLESEEKFQICGAVLCPDKNIYRVDDEGYEYYIRFSKEAIEEIAHSHLRNYKNNNFSTDHEAYTSNIYLYESWIAENENDKAFTKYGLDCPVGSWIILCKVDSTEIWERIKANELAGFSIEAWLQFDEVYQEIENKLKKEYTMSNNEKNSFLDEIKEIIKETLSALKSENVQIEEKVEEVVETALEEETVVEEETKNEEEVLEEVVETALEEEVNVEEVKEEETVAEEVVDTEKVEMAATITEQQAEIDRLKAEIEKLSKQPSTKPENGNGASRGDVMEMLRSLEMSRPK